MWGISGFYTWTDFIWYIVQYIDFASYAGDNTIYAPGESIDDLILSLQESSKNFSK